MLLEAGADARAATVPFDGSLRSNWASTGRFLAELAPFLDCQAPSMASEASPSSQGAQRPLEYREGGAFTALDVLLGSTAILPKDNGVVAAQFESLKEILLQALQDCPGHPATGMAGNPPGGGVGSPGEGSP